MRLLEIRSRGDDATGRFIVEGRKLLGEVLGSPHVVEEVFLLDGGEEGLPPLHPRVDISVVSEGVMRKISSLTTPNRLAAICRKSAAPRRDEWESRPHWLVLDGIQDPGNVGAILRCAVAFGKVPVMRCGPGPSPFSEKVVRASAGASLHATFSVYPDFHTFKEAVRGDDRPLYCLDPRGATPLCEVDRRQRGAFLVGGEGRGPRPDAAEASLSRIRIPMEPGSESLNVASAAAVLLHHLYRRDRF